MIGIGVIGYGYWGPNLVRNFAEVADSHVVAVADLQPERLALAQSRYPTVEISTDFRDLLASPRVDAVAIATPVSTHFDLVMRALQAGKHVLVEKPLAATAEQADRLIEEAGRRQQVLMVGHTFVYTSAVRKIKELVDGGRLGQLYYYDSVRVNLGLFQHDVNVLWDLAVHDLAIMDYVLGFRPHSVSAIGAAHVSGHPENIAYMTCFFDHGFVAHFHVNWLAPVKVRYTLIGGDRRMVIYNDLEGSEKIKIYDKGVHLKPRSEKLYESLVSYRIGDMRAPRLSQKEALQTEVEHFIGCIQRKKTPLTDGSAGLRVIQILEAASESMHHQGKRVAVQYR